MLQLVREDHSDCSESEIGAYRREREFLPSGGFPRMDFWFLLRNVLVRAAIIPKNMTKSYLFLIDAFEK